MIKEFNFDANTPYEQTLVGKGIKNEIDNPTVPNFVGKTVNEAEQWGNSNNVEIIQEYVDSTSSKYNDNVGLGLIASQSINAGASLTNISKLTIYINTTKPDNPKPEVDDNDVSDEPSTPTDNEEDLNDVLDDGLEGLLP